MSSSNLYGYLTNCNKYYVTCQNSYVIPNDDSKIDLNCLLGNDFSMPRETRGCRRSASGTCTPTSRTGGNTWPKKKATSSDTVNQKYEAELKNKLTTEELVKVLEKQVGNNNKIVLLSVDTVSRCIQDLDAIALRPNPLLTPQYIDGIDLIIDAEQQEKHLCFT